MALISLKKIGIRFGADPVLDGVDLTIQPQEKIALIGRNGAGKSTLLKLIQGHIEADSGEIIRQENLVANRLVQEVPNHAGLTVRCVVAQGEPTLGAKLTAYYQTEAEINTIDFPPEVWDLDQITRTLCSKLALHADDIFDDLSGGNKRKVLLAQALVTQPNLLLLDEPTNHLDIETILWLEQFISSLNIAVIIVSHDRAFLDKICQRYIEIDRGACFSFVGNYQNYLHSKQKMLEQEERHNKKFDKFLAQEEQWIRQGIQARRTRNEGRVRALKKLRLERQKRREVTATAKMQINSAEISGKVVIECKQLHHGFDNKKIVNDFNCRIVRKDKIGIIGPNGCGKTTLIKLLTGEIKPDAGTVKLGTNLKLAYLDQHRKAINDELSVIDNVSPKSEVTINGKSKHIIAYLQDFLFSPARAQAPAKKLSGGERNRLLIAKLFTQEFNLLILDEPTNDLDFETLELLEQILVSFNGTLLLVSHDRTFLNNIVSSTIAYDADGVFREYIGGYEDWLRQRPKYEKANESKKAKKAPSVHTQDAKSKKKLSYKLQRELQLMPERIAQLEEKLQNLNQTMLEPNFYQQASHIIAEISKKSADTNQQLEQCYARWEELESLD